MDWVRTIAPILIAVIALIGHGAYLKGKFEGYTELLKELTTLQEKRLNRHEAKMDKIWDAIDDVNKYLRNHKGNDGGPK